MILEKIKMLKWTKIIDFNLSKTLKLQNKKMLTIMPYTISYRHQLNFVTIIKFIKTGSYRKTTRKFAFAQVLTLCCKI